MQYELSPAAFFTGLLILVIGVTFVRFHQWVADNFGSGIASYERYRLYAFIVCLLGLMTILNLPAFLLGSFFSTIFNR